MTAEVTEPERLSKPAPKPAARRGVDPDAWALLALAVAVLWVYLPPAVWRGEVLFGADSFTLHVRRLEFAREHLLGVSPSLPAWYPREFLGTPFWSNLQNFPLLPTRLPLLLVDPWTAHTVGVNLAAVLAAAFTFLLCRRLGLGRVGAAVAAWTFACCGFFAARVLAGHLPLLEAYPALPLLLWLIERYLASDTPRRWRGNVLALAAAAGLVMLAGHPQLPVYAVAAALLYLPVRASRRGALRGAAAMVAGIACASFALYPMGLLAGRSTRVLPLDPAANDVAFPPWRLKALVTPWADGWPSLVAREAAQVPFAGADQHVFWDTVCYVGLLPLAAVAALAIRAAVARRLPPAPWVFVAVVGAAALLLALPWSGSGDGGSWTILRSPARQLYLTVFALSLAGGAGVEALLRLRGRFPGAGGTAIAVVAAGLVVTHAFDLRRHATAFVVTTAAPPDTAVASGVAEAVGDGRVAMDANRIDPVNRRFDDVGVFDSILLARPYRALLALSGRPPQTNTQYISGPDLGTRALAWSGVRVVVTARTDLALPVLDRGGPLTAYTVPGALPRAGFVPASGVQYAYLDAMLRDMRGGAAPDAGRMFLFPQSDPAGSVPPPPTSGPAAPPGDAAAVTYRRPSPDRIEVDVSAPVEGYVRVLEAWDPGWMATVDGAPAEVLSADGFVSAVRVGRGAHAVRLTYRTPGVGVGVAFSAVGVIALAALVWSAGRVAAPGASA